MERITRYLSNLIKQMVLVGSDELEIGLSEMEVWRRGNWNRDR